MPNSSRDDGCLSSNNRDNLLGISLLQDYVDGTGNNEYEFVRFRVHLLHCGMKIF